MPRAIIPLTAIAVCTLTPLAMLLLSPVWRLPKPSGRHVTGTVTTVFSGPQPYEASGGPRQLVVQFWYPAEPDAAKVRASYRPPALIPGRSPLLRLVRVSALENADAARGGRTFPLIVYSPAWQGNRFENSVLAQELASQGFVVACIDHPLSSGQTVYPDGRVVQSLGEGWLDFSSEPAWKRSQQVVGRHLRMRLADIHFLLKTLAGPQSSPRLAAILARVDFARLGIFGYSFGGSVAAEACAVGGPFRAGLNLDGLLLGEASRNGVAMPFFFLNQDLGILNTVSAEEGSGSLRSLALHRDYESMKSSVFRHGGYLMSIQGSDHSDFSDQAYHLKNPFRANERTAPSRAAAIAKAYTVSYFKRHLLNEEEPLWGEARGLYPEVSLRQGSTALAGKGNERATQ